MQILNVSNLHWCVVSTIDCNPDEVKVYDTMYRKVQSSTIPIIASFVFCTRTSLTISVVDVGRQSNRYDCGVLAIAVAYDLCAGNDPLTMVYEHRTIRQHLMECLKKCTISRFPIRETRTTREVIDTQVILLFCTCRMPEELEIQDPMAMCVSCKEWYHNSCMDIPDVVWKDKTIQWKCKSCAST